jgi:hypothetical protein
MAILAHKDTRAALAANGLVGRSAACTLRLDDPRASAEHARLSFRDGHWVIRDLGSRNGTFVNAQRMEPGGTRTLAAGDRLSFGDVSIVWALADASPPVAMARRLSTDQYVAASGGGMLALPSPDEPLACVLEDEGGAWTIEIDGQSRQAADGEVLTLGGEPFMLHLPVPMPSTVEGQERRTTIDSVELRFRVSRNEEAVEVTVVDARGPHVLSPRTHHYTLLTLARARARDREDSRLADSQRGWVFVDELCRMLSVDEYRLNTEIYRIRQDVATIGLSNAAALVERRRGSRQLRVATERVKIAGME